MITPVNIVNEDVSFTGVVNTEEEITSKGRQGLTEVGAWEEPFGFEAAT